ncbi:MAG: oligosaccharide flippase family protein [Caulobacteraceae bacterium]|nr:oligosaccharide flippase family protein [Caulobacteraceae bacterium]
MSEAVQPAQKPAGPAARSLGAAARSAIFWSGGATLARDVLQFAVMLALVRILTPSDYGRVALAQSIIGLMSVVSFSMFVGHALQMRDPSQVDWQAHFTAAAVLNSALFLLACAVAWGLSFSARYHEAAWPLAGLATTFLVEIAGSLRLRMLETRHDWKRFRLLVMAGAALGLCVGLAVAALGGGCWGLVAQPPLFGVPAAIDLFVGARWRPTWSWSWSAYRPTAAFGANRAGGAAVVKLRQTVEQSLLAGRYDFAALGVFTRSLGLATLLAGRLGELATASVYPVITRAAPGSPQFQRYAGLVMRAISWATLAAAGFLALAAVDVTALIYGARWRAVGPLLPVAVAPVALVGLGAAANTLLLANNQVRACLVLDVAAASTSALVAFVLVPFGPTTYLEGLAVHSGLVLAATLALLMGRGGVGMADVAAALVPPAIAAALAAAPVLALKPHLAAEPILLRLPLEFALFTLVYLLVLRIAFAGPLAELLQVAPAGERLSKLLRVRPAPAPAFSAP